jgi:hypothetical protein
MTFKWLIFIKYDGILITQKIRTPLKPFQPAIRIHFAEAAQNATASDIAKVSAPSNSFAN